MDRQFVVDSNWLMNQWDYEKNLGMFDPCTLTIGSKKEPWWICEQGHSYKQQINAKYSQKQGCPYCSGKKVLVGFNDLATTDPDIAKEWSALNPFKPTEVTRGSRKKVEWECINCKQTWPAQICLRTLNRTKCPYCSNHKPIPGISDLATKFPSIAAEWDADNNKDEPEEYLPYSKHIAFWKCPACQLSYPMAIQNRTQQNQGCPKCAKRKQTSFPEQAIYYYLKQVFPDCDNKSFGILPGKMELDIYIPSRKTAIEYDGQRWHRDGKTQEEEKRKYNECKNQGITLIRVRESSLELSAGIADTVLVSDYDQGKRITALIPVIEELSRLLDVQIDFDFDRDEIEIRNQYIRGIKDTSAASLYPWLLEEWDQKNNGDITLFMISAGDKTKYYWNCKQCGHSWKATAYHRIQGEGCPRCARRKASDNSRETYVLKNGSLIEHFPLLEKEWDYEKNTDVNPYKITAKTNRIVWWLCKHGHSYQARVSDRTSKGSGCPYCAGKLPIVGENDLKTTHKELMLDWDYSKNNPPTNYKAGSNKTVWWKCHICGYEWQAKIYSRALNGRGCKECHRNRTNMS